MGRLYPGRQDGIECLQQIIAARKTRGPRTAAGQIAE
jgi:hypothetical protein